jgi:hypothetical protein
MIQSLGRVWGRRAIDVATLLSCATALVGCATFFGRPEQGQTVREQARICFRQSQDAHVLASATPIDCYSYRCAHLSQATGTAVVDGRAYRIDFETTFHIAETRPLLGGCLPDCMGGGQLDFDLGPLVPALYEIKLWGTQMGHLSVTSGLPWQDQCLPGDEPRSRYGIDSSVAAAEQNLIRFFGDLNDGDFEAAAALYGGSYDTMVEQNPDLDPTDRAVLLRAACTLNGAQCLEIRSARSNSTATTDGDEYVFIVEFNRADGSRFSLGPCCGGTADDMAPQTEFRFEVMEMPNHQFKVLTPPVYMP